MSANTDAPRAPGADWSAFAATPTVRSHMDAEVKTLGPDVDVFAAVNFLLDHNLPGAPVVDASNMLVGMISQKDLLKLLSAGTGGEPVTGRVSDFMTRNVISIPPKMDIYYAAGMLIKHPFRSLPVVEGGHLLGLLTRRNVLRAVRSRLRAMLDASAS